MSTWWRRGLALIVSASMVLGSTPAQALGEAIEEVEPTEDVAQVEAADEEPELEVATSEEALPEDDVEEPAPSPEDESIEADEGQPIEIDSAEPESVDEITLTTQACSSGIMNNGLGGISIDVNASPYTDFAAIPTWGAYAYGQSGCAWFASARVRQITGLGSTIWSGQTWWESGYASLGFSRGSTIAAPALACYANHVAVVEKIVGDTAYISEGGSTYYSDAAHGYTVIRTMSVSEICGRSDLYGFVYLPGTVPNDRQPLGKVDASAAGPSAIRVAGWAYDPDVPSQSIDVDVYVDGQMAARVPANTVRTDVNNAFGITGNHGFDATFVTTVRGTHKVVVYALNNKHDGGNPALDNDYTSEFTVNVTDPSVRNGAICELPQHEWFMLVPSCSQTRAMRIESAANGSVAEISGGDGVVGLSSYYWFSFVKHSSGSYGIQWERDDSYYLHVSTDWTANAGIVGWQTYGNANSLWVPEKNSDGTYSFRNAAYNTYIDLRGGQDTFNNTFCHYPGNGSNAQKFRLVPVHKSLSDSNVTVTCPQTVAYTGSAVKPNIKVEFMGITLVEGEDYTVSYQNNTARGTATATVTGVGGTPVNTDFRGFRGWYEGSRTVNFTIGEADTESPVIQSATIVEQTDEKVVVDVVATDNSGVLPFAYGSGDTHSNVHCTDVIGDRQILGGWNTSSVVALSNTKTRVTVDLAYWKLAEQTFMGGDTHRLTFTARDAAGNTAETTVDFDFQMSKHASLEVGGSITAREIFGKGVGTSYLLIGSGLDKIQVTRADTGDVYTALEAGTCWLYYINNKHGNVLSARITIAKPVVDISGTTIPAIADQTYTGSAIKPAVTVTLDGTTLVADTDYAVSYANNVDAGTATVTVTGKGNYAGSVSRKFTIARASVAVPKATNYTYDGKGHTGIAKGTGYALSGTATATNAGAYEATATPDANHKWADGTTTAKKVTWSIAKAASSITLAAQTTTYTGKALAYTGKVTKSGSAGAVTYAYYSDAGCTKAVKAADVKAAGTYYVKATLAADANHKGATSAAATLAVAKAKNPIAAKAVARTASAKTLKSKAVAIKKPSVSVSKAQGKVKYAKASGAKCLSINKTTGRVTVKKGTKKGTYKIKVKVTAAGNANYKAGSKTVTCKVTVK